MYSKQTGLLLGFHGCDQSVSEKVISGKINLVQSNNEYDWLGHGIYFWENSPSRALQFANHLKNNPQKKHNLIEKPTAIGAVLNLGLCLDLLDYSNLQLLKIAYELLEISENNSHLPSNKFIGTDNDLMLRNLDCAVIESLHKLRTQNNQEPFDSVRGVFWEGKELYPNAGFREKDHIQICIRNPNCIKGYFLPREINENFKTV